MITVIVVRSRILLVLVSTSLLLLRFLLILFSCLSLNVDALLQIFVDLLNVLDQVWHQVCKDLVVGLQFLLVQGQFKVGFQCSLLKGSFSGLVGTKQYALQLIDFCFDSTDVVTQLLFDFGVCLLSLPQ